MPTILIVEKSGVIKESNIKTWVEADLYKKAGFKSPDGFTKAHEWTIDGTTVALYGKTDGKAGQENKYDFPPPVDTTLFFGSCILTIAESSLKVKQWDTIYETLFGGFEDVGSEDSDESEDEDDELDLPRTKEGYVKDDFIVDDDDEDEEDDEIEDDDEEIEEVVVPKKSKPAKRAPPKEKKSKKLTVFEKIDTDIDIEDSLLCTDELEEELYDE
jgi:hypothetical protein